MRRSISERYERNMPFKTQQQTVHVVGEVQNPSVSGLQRDEMVDDTERFIGTLSTGR